MYISLVSLSIDGNLMCTVDVKLPEDELGGLVTLKFWNHGSSAGDYSLSTVIYEPHRLVLVIKFPNTNWKYETICFNFYIKSFMQ